MLLKTGIYPAKIGSLSLPKIIKKFYPTMYHPFLKYCIDRFWAMQSKIVREQFAKILPLLLFTINKLYIFDHAGNHLMPLYCITIFSQCKCRQASDRFLICLSESEYTLQKAVLYSRVTFCLLD